MSAFPQASLRNATFWLPIPPPSVL